jgi:hypothetical protein
MPLIDAQTGRALGRMVKWIITRSFYLLIPGSNPGTPVKVAYV